jgi:hypothetical protein
MTSEELAERKCTFQPEVNEVSRAIERSKPGPPVSRAEKLYSLRDYKERKRKQLLEQAETAHEAASPFQPKLVSQKARSSVIVQESKTGVVDRMLSWHSHKQRQMVEKRAEREEAEEREYTFKPKVSKLPASGVSTAPEMCSGVDRFVRRLRKARMEAENTGVPCDGSGWTPEPTAHKPFQFRHAIAIDSLRRPVDRSPQGSPTKKKKRPATAPVQSPAVPTGYSAPVPQEPAAEDEYGDDRPELNPGMFSDFGRMLSTSLAARSASQLTPSAEYIRRREEKQLSELAERESDERIRPWRHEDGAGPRSPSGQPGSPKRVVSGEAEHLQRMAKSRAEKERELSIKEAGYTKPPAAWTPDITQPKPFKFATATRPGTRRDRG